MNKRSSCFVWIGCLVLLTSGCNDSSRTPGGSTADPVPLVGPIFDPDGSFGSPQFPPPVDPQPEPTPEAELHLVLRGLDDTGAAHAVTGRVHVEWRDPENGELLGEHGVDTDDAGTARVAFGNIVDTHRYTLRITASDDWYFVPESVAYFYGMEMTGEALRQAALQPLLLNFRPNDEAIAYVKSVGIVEDFRERFPDRNGIDAVFEVTMSTRGLREGLFTGECEYYFEDFYLADADTGDLLPASYTREVFAGPADCSENYGSFLMAVQRIAVDAPDFWNGLTWDSLIAMDPVDDTESTVFILTQSSRYYVDGVLYGE